MIELMNASDPFRFEMTNQLGWYRNAILYARLRYSLYVAHNDHLNGVRFEKHSR